jgi:hypothetical protein
MSQELIIVIVLALIFDLLNGMRDASNIVATMISSRAFSPRMALGIAAVAEFLGPFLFGVVVAKTIGENIVQSNALTLDVIVAALVGAIAWNLITWYFGIPGSSSHALIGGMVGAVIVGAGTDAIKFGGLNRVLIALFTSPLVGFVAVDLLFGTECDAAHQFLLQAQPVDHRCGNGIQSRDQRRPKNHGDHRPESGHRRSPALVSSPGLGGCRQRRGHRGGDEPGRLAVDPHAGRQIL